MPAIGVLYTGVAKIWGLPFAPEFCQTLEIVSVFIGAMIGISTKGYNDDKKAEDENKN